MINEFKRIMIVEDEEDHARIILKALKKNGYNDEDLDWQDNGQKALDKLNESLLRGEPLPWLILLDQKMPIKTGFEVLDELKKNSSLKSIPVVMLTTASDTDDIKMALGKGANDYIVKPVKFEDFMEKVNRLGFYWDSVSDAKNSLKEKA